MSPKPTFRFERLQHLHGLLLTQRVHTVGIDIATEALASLPDLLHARAVCLFRTLGLCRTISLATVDDAAQVRFSCPNSFILVRLGYVGHRFDRTP